MIIIGGGVAGSTAAIVLARHNLQVTIVEREADFRDRVRGEGIHPWGMNEVTALDLEGIIASSDGCPLTEWRTWEKGELANTSVWADSTLDGAVETSVVHTSLQNQMLAEAEHCGVHVHRPARPVRARYSAGVHEVTIRSAGAERIIVAPILIAADGARSWVCTQYGIARHQDPVHHWIVGLSVANHCLDPVATHAVAIEGGRSFIFPQQNGLARMYLVLRNDAIDPIRRDRTGTAALALPAVNLPTDALIKATLAGPQGAFPNGDTWPEPHVVPGLLLIGDAVGSNDPSQGHGLSLTMRDARELRDIIGRGDRLDPANLAALEGTFRTYRQTLRMVGQWAARLWMTVGDEAEL